MSNKLIEEESRKIQKAINKWRTRRPFSCVEFEPEVCANCDILYHSIKTSLNEVVETREKEILDNAEELVSEAHKLGLNGEQTQVRIQTRNLIKKILKK